MCTSLGGLVAGCAAARAGIQRISELPGPGSVEPDEVNVSSEGPIGGQEGEENVEGEGQGAGDDLSEGEESVNWGHQARGLPEGSTGMERLARLGAAALTDLFSEYPEAGNELGRLGLILCLPSGYLDWAHPAVTGEGEDAFSSGVFVDPAEGARLQVVKDALLPTLFSLVPDLPEPTWTGLVLEDQAGFAEGVARAVALLSQGRLDSCLLGGIDSRLDPEMLKALEELGLLQTPDFPAGFIPGEAGAFLLLRPSGAAPEPLAEITAAAQAADGAHRFSGAPPVGDSLTETVRLVLGGEGATEAGLLVLGSVNGSPWTSNEWGYLLTRLRVVGDAHHWFPVGSIGETGAALGPVSACMAMRGFARGYAGAHQAVIVLSSESGRKGAVVMRRSESAGGMT
jgi:3-oxoacyl-[acyl-carrier-protein] synthase-1